MQYGCPRLILGHVLVCLFSWVLLAGCGETGGGGSSGNVADVHILGGHTSFDPNLSQIPSASPSPAPSAAPAPGPSSPADTLPTPGTPPPGTTASPSMVGLSVAGLPGNLHVNEQATLSAFGGIPPYAYAMYAGEGYVDPVGGQFLAGPDAGTSLVEIRDSAGAILRAEIRVYRANTSASPIVATFHGADFACELFDTGVIKCWGGNSFGQLGDGTYHARGTPVPVRRPLGQGFVTRGRGLSINGTKVCTVTLSDEFLCWGEGRIVATPE
ncbi:MAG: hypothetical protein HY075_05935 [Deltaproteobacteria bacterium]|nr:hypothetical protein [Deltaproteobacteria bacterium]